VQESSSSVEDGLAARLRRAHADQEAAENALALAAAEAESLRAAQAVDQEACAKSDTANRKLTEQVSAVFV